jgi:hypothetical protein
MKTKDAINTLKETRAVLLSAISELDVRGTDTQITKAMCVVEATLDAAIAGKRISSVNALKHGLALSFESSSE